jgi:hypothetical protein
VGEAGIAMKSGFIATPDVVVVDVAAPVLDCVIRRACKN